MKLSLLPASILICLIVAAPLAMADDAPIAKQLSGPPSDFALMQTPNPADAAIFSKSALIQVGMAADRSGVQSWSRALPVESPDMRFIVYSGNTGDWQVQMRSPDGDQRSAQAYAAEHRVSEFGIQNAMLPVDYFAFSGLQPGDWSLDLQSRVPSESLQRGFVLLEGDPSTRLMSYQASGKQWVGEPIQMVASLMLEADAGPVRMANQAGQINSAEMIITAPSGQLFNVSMAAERTPKGDFASNGIFTGNFVPAEAGLYQVQVQVSGVNRIGAPVLRTAEHLIAVIEPSLSLSSERASAGMLADQRFDLRVAVAAERSGQHYRSYAEVWGRNASGKEIPVAWVGGMVTPNGGAVSFPLDQRWVVLAGAQAPFELRNLRFEDPDHYVVAASADRMALSLPALSIDINARNVVVDESMLMGPRPLDLERATGSRLLLVHGYCSGGVWPANQFSTASSFLDVNQNRTHDQFAQRIRNFGASWNSFGVVAHSQGGAASLHLYSYYWSGLDNASGNRLIQSVGTPYQGTNLAGILATLGNWFGVGCGTNNDLSYSGASSWLSGIPSWARSKVNYYTTSFATAWWRWDFCNAATDLVLSDPEDGTTERHKGQLSGGVNRGHATGQCHTDGMRDPAQYRNSSRNSTMNSNAAR